MQFDNSTTPSSWIPSLTTSTEILPDTITKPTEKTKRKQVKNACVNCQKACKKCDDGRPCKRCVKLGLTATCRDSDRKERKKGVKRGPYKKRQAYIKDKPVYPKMTEERWTTPIYENVPQVLSHHHQSIYSDDLYCVPSQAGTLSPVSSSSFVDESDETLHNAYGYGYTTSTNTIISSPDESTTIYNAWDFNSPIGCYPIIHHDATVLDILPTTYPQQQQQHQQQKTNMELLNDSYDWYNTTDSVYPPQQQQQQNYYEYTIPSNTPHWY